MAFFQTLSANAKKPPTSDRREIANERAQTHIAASISPSPTLIHVYAMLCVWPDRRCSALFRREVADLEELCAGGRSSAARTDTRQRYCASPTPTTLLLRLPESLRRYFHGPIAGTVLLAL